MTPWHAVAFLSGVWVALGILDWRKGERIAAVASWFLAGIGIVAAMVLS